jgi:hypothetical protein
MSDPNAASVRNPYGAPPASFWLVALLVPVVMLVADGWVDAGATLALTALAWIAGAAWVLHMDGRARGGLTKTRGVALVAGLALATLAAGAVAVIAAIWFAIQF